MTGSLASRDASSIRHKLKGRSTIEGVKVVAILSLACGLAAGIGLWLFPADAWLVGIVIGFAWLTGTAFVLFFFRDADPQPPSSADVVVSPSHGTVDYIDTVDENQFLHAPARRISIYLSLLNVHVQHAPVTGRTEVLQHFPGRWSRAVRRDSSMRNEHLLIGLELEDDRKMALRLISGIWVRRIVPWISAGQKIERGERIGLIRFGSRVDVFLPLEWEVGVRPGDRVRGGETVIARRTGKD